MHTTPMFPSETGRGSARQQAYYNKAEIKTRQRKKKNVIVWSTLTQGYQWHSFVFNISPSILSHSNCQWKNATDKE